MSFGNPADAALNDLFDPKKAHLFYKDPQAHLAEVVGIYERCATCKYCGKKELRVISWEEKKSVCKSCKKEQ
ncbi:MAG: hypothetical protein WC819_02540 [Parcubacteria group bacterium]|jgi:hypothetical protein